MSSPKKVHPLYAAMLSAWQANHDCYDGEDAVKSKGSVYLPPTGGMRLDGFGTINSIGQETYNAYLLRSHFPDIFADTVDTAIGVMHRKPAVIELPPKLQGLLTKATETGEDLQLLLRKINTMQLISGRVGILGDIRTGEDGLPYPVIVLYSEKACYNWDDSASGDDSSYLRFVALDESAYELQADFGWEKKTKSRLLALIDKSTNSFASYSNGKLPDNVVYGFAEITGDQDIATATYTPVNAQGTESSKIPFVFVNTKDLSSCPDKPSLSGLASLIFAIYRGEADYRQNLFAQGQDTLVTIGSNIDEEETVRTGAGARLDLPINGDAKYIGVGAEGLTEQRECLKRDYERAEARGSKLMVSGSGGAESGDALRIRVAGQTATLPQIAQTGAMGLKMVLSTLAVMLGENPDDIKLDPNLEFADSKGNSQTLLQLVQSKIQGAPISDASIHEWMVENNFTYKTYEDELALLQNEEPRI